MLMATGIVLALLPSGPAQGAARVGRARAAVPAGASTVAASAAQPAWYRPAQRTSWQWQIDGTVDTTVPVQLYDIDLQDAVPAATQVTVRWPAAGGYQATVIWPRGTNAGLVQRLHARGSKVICYTDTGAFENYRPDAALFPGHWGRRNATRLDSDGRPLPYLGPPAWRTADVIGGSSEASNGSTFAGEYWLDQRSTAWRYWEPIMVARMALAKRIGCDAMEGDQNNAYDNDRTFGVTQADSLLLYQEMFRQQHQAGLGALAKNGLEVIPQLLRGVPNDPAGLAKPDGFLNEECNYYSECRPNLTQAAAAGYWVGQVEYTENGSTTSFCAADNRAGFMGLLKHLDLGSWARQCWPAPQAGTVGAGSVRTSTVVPVSWRRAATAGSRRAVLARP